jgi:hypothetical protein
MSDSILQEYVEPPVICSNYFVSTEHKTVQDDMLAGLKNRLIYTNGAKIPHDLFRHSLMFLQDYDQSGFLKGKIQVYRFDLDTLFPKLKNPLKWRDERTKRNLGAENPNRGSEL